MLCNSTQMFSTAQLINARKPQLVLTSQALLELEILSKSLKAFLGLNSSHSIFPLDSQRVLS